MNWKEVKPRSQKQAPFQPHFNKRPALFQAKQKEELGNMLRFGGVQEFGVDMPVPGEGSYQKNQEPNQNSHHLPEMILSGALHKLAKCFLRYFLNRVRAWGETINMNFFQAFLLVSG